MKNNLQKIFFPMLLSILVFAACTGRKIDSHLKRAEELKGTRKFDEALDVYKLIINRWPNDVKTAIAYLKMGDLYFYTLNKEEDGIASYDKVVEKWPLETAAKEAALKKADIFSGRGNYKRAVAEYEWVLKYFPGHEEAPAVKLKLAETYLSLQDPYQASVELTELLNMENLPPDVLSKAIFDLGESYLEMGEYKKALQYFVELDQKHANAPFILDARLNIIECLEKLGRIEEAATLQRKLAAMNPDSDIVKKRGEALKRREKKGSPPE